MAAKKVLFPTGTTIHPVWSVDRQEWVPLAELAEGEVLQGLDGLAVVLSVTLSRGFRPVYNIRVDGERVYQAGELGFVVHNSYLREAMIKAFGHPGPGWQAVEIIPESGFWRAPRELKKIRKAMEKAGLMDNNTKLFLVKGWSCRFAYESFPQRFSEDKAGSRWSKKLVSRRRRTL